MTEFFVYRLEKSKGLAEARLEDLTYQVKGAVEEVKRMEYEEHTIMIDINNHITDIADKEEACLGIKTYVIFYTKN